ncbi:MAG: sigma-70 family RNA polymerase sigma factor [Oscillospiraceae bacterium]|nr:sigma-70 family RNA polymerase sigma factor [Oscillospiraceae bacterium]
MIGNVNGYDNVHINSAEAIKAAQSGDNEMLSKITESNMGLVKSIAQRFCGRGAEYEDLVQIGAVGMIKAIRNFSPDFGCAFSTYAVPLIAGEIKRFLRDDGLVKISRTTKSNASIIARFTKDFQNAYGREPTMPEIIEGTAISEEDAVCAIEASRPVLSINEKRGDDDDFTLEDVIGDDSLSEVVDSIALSEAISLLSDDEKLIIRLRYFKGLTQQQCAKLLDSTQVRISRAEKKIIEKLKRNMAG